MENIQIKVSPQKINAKADEVVSYIGELYKSLEEINKRMAYLEKNWKGEAASEYITIYKIQAKEIENVVKGIERHIGELKSAAQIYEGVTTKIDYEHHRNLPKGFLE